MNNKLDRLKDIKVENFIWIIYIGIIVLSYIANSKEKNFILTNNGDSKHEYQILMIIIFTILLFVYYYFVSDSIEDVKSLKNDDDLKKVLLNYASLIGSILILISGIIFLLIAILDDNIDTEIAFN